MSQAAALLEFTGAGPTLTFDEPAVVAIGGTAMAATVDGRPIPPRTPVAVPAGATVQIGPTKGPGLRAAFGIRGGLDVPTYLGSRSTFTLGQFGGHEGRALRAGDVIPIGKDVAGAAGPLPPGMASRLTDRWEIGVLVGPHTAPEFRTGIAVMHAEQPRFGWGGIEREEAVTRFSVGGADERSAEVGELMIERLTGEMGTDHEQLDRLSWGICHTPSCPPETRVTPG